MKMGSSSTLAGMKAGMRARTRARTFVLPLALGVGVLLAVQADAQQPSPSPAAPPAAPEGAAPPPAPDARPQTPRWREGAGGDWNRGGWNRGGGPRAALSDEDRRAFFSARLAAIKAGLLLTPEQEKLWPPAEAAVRDMVRQRAEARDQFRKEGRPSNPIDALRKMGEMQAARGEAMKKMADAVGPLYASLNDDQKRRLRFLTRGTGRMAMAGHHGFDHHMGPGGERGGWGRGRSEGPGPGMDRDHEMRRGPEGDGPRGPGRRWREGMNERQGWGRDADRGLGRGQGADLGDFDRSGGFDRGNGIEDWRNGL